LLDYPLAEGRVEDTSQYQENQHRSIAPTNRDSKTEAIGAHEAIQHFANCLSSKKAENTRAW